MALEPLPPLTWAQQDAIFHAVQECLTNAARHAPGARVEVSVLAEDGEVLVRCQDFGPGAVFGAGGGAGGGAGDGSLTWGNGLTGMSERFAALGGMVTAQAGSLGAGTGGFRVVARFPYEAGLDG